MRASAKLENEHLYGRDYLISNLKNPLKFWSISSFFNVSRLTIEVVSCSRGRCIGEGGGGGADVTFT